MLPKRFIEGKSVLNKNRRDPAEPGTLNKRKCDRRRSECVAEFCADHSTLIEETVKMSLLGCVLWAGLTLGSWVAPYPLNLIVSSDIMHPPPLYDFPFPSAENLRRLPTITSKHTNRSVTLGMATVDMLSRLEENLQASGIVTRGGSTARGLLLHGYPSDEGMHYDKSSMIIMRASENLVATRCTRFGLHTDECASFISTLNLRDSSFGGECAALESFDCAAVKSRSRYRTFDGSCNNPVRSSWGQALTGYKRLLHPKYADGIDEPRRATNHRELPSARLVSETLTSEAEQPHESITIAFAVWAHFVHHDLAHTPVKKMVHSGSSIRCCDDSGRALAPRYRHPSCLPIAISEEDPYFNSTYSTCMEYVRSATTYRGDCTFGASEQMNQATHFLDLSHVYGASSRAAARLRQPTGGLLKTELSELGELLPQMAGQDCLNDSVCFESGDLRANLHPWLTALHTVWAREHNRVARALAAINPAWSSERLYHEARRIVIATAQSITYKHWLTKLGPSLEEIYDDTDYNQDVDPTVTNSFATAAFSFVHSLLVGDIHMLDKNGTVEKSLELMRHFYRPSTLKVNGAIEKILRGMISQRSQKMDLNFVDDMRHGWLGGLDALAIDIQRGRDHALPSYLQYRTLCNLPHVDTMQQMSDVMSQEAIENLSQLYSSPHDIDLVVGAMAERPAPGSLLGPTFTCLIKEQLRRTRAGDRFFFTHSSEAGGFSKRQLQELNRSSLARLLCDNVPGLDAVRWDVFTVESSQNPRVSCDEIKRVNLDAWREEQSDILSRTQTNVKKWIKTRVNG